MPYAKNKIIPRTAELKPLRWYEQTQYKQASIQLEGEFTFDFYHDIDRERWFKMFINQQQKTNANDRYFLAKELVAKEYIKNMPKNPEEIFNTNIIPVTTAESARSFLYNELIGRHKIIKTYIMPQLRKFNIFFPITPILESKYFSFDMNSFELEKIQIPNNHQMKEIFKITFKVNFDVRAYLQHIIIERHADFYLSLWPTFEFRMNIPTGFPFVITGNERNSFIRWLNPLLSELMIKDRKILMYVYKKTKVRLDKIKHLKIEMGTDNRVKFDTDDLIQFIFQLVKGKINLFGNSSNSQSFKIKAIDPDFAKNKIEVSRTNLPLNLLYIYIIYRVFIKKKKNITPNEVLRLAGDVKFNRKKLEDL